MILYDFKCSSCDKVQEAFGKMDDKEQVVDCFCGGHAKRIISPVTFKLEGCSGAYPTAYDKWEKKRAQHMKWEKKHGIELQT